MPVPSPFMSRRRFALGASAMCLAPAAAAGQAPAPADGRPAQWNAIRQAPPPTDDLPAQWDALWLRMRAYKAYSAPSEDALLDRIGARVGLAVPGVGRPLATLWTVSPDILAWPDGRVAMPSWALPLARTARRATLAALLADAMVRIRTATRDRGMEGVIQAEYAGWIDNVIFSDGNGRNRWEAPFPGPVANDDSSLARCLAAAGLDPRAAWRMHGDLQDLKELLDRTAYGATRSPLASNLERRLRADPFDAARQRRLRAILAGMGIRV